jgi:four helix bundle protein
MLSVQDCGMAKYDLEDRLIRFGSTTCGLAERFPRTPLGQHVAVQLVRSSTSPFANYGEVQSAESRRDFIHKLGICLKELRETRTWLKFVREMNLTTPELVDPALRECDQLLAILATSIKTARANARQ